MLSIQSIFKPFLAFRFIIIAGIVMGLWLCSMQSEQTPISALLTEGRIYLISFLIVVGFHILLWIIVEKASFYDIGGYLMRILRDTIIINAVVLSTVAACFLINTFLLI